MEQIVELLANSENVRMLVIIAVSLCGFMKLNMSFDKRFYALDKKIDSVEYSLNKRIDGVEYSLNKKIDDLEVSLLKRMDEKIDTKLGAFYAQLKANDFAHLNATIEALTFTLEKNDFLKREDKEYIDSRLDR